MNTDKISFENSDSDDSFDIFELQPADSLVDSFNQSISFKFPFKFHDFLLNTLVELEIFEAKVILLQSKNSIHFFSLFNDLLESIIKIQSICLTILQLDQSPSLQLEYYQKYHSFISLMLESFRKNLK